MRGVGAKLRAWGTGPEVPSGQVRKAGAERWTGPPLGRSAGAGSAQRSEEIKGPWSADNTGGDGRRER